MGVTGQENTSTRWRDRCETPSYVCIGRERESGTGIKILKKNIDSTCARPVPWGAHSWEAEKQITSRRRGAPSRKKQLLRLCAQPPCCIAFMTSYRCRSHRIIPHQNSWCWYVTSRLVVVDVITTHRIASHQEWGKHCNAGLASKCRARLEVKRDLATKGRSEWRTTIYASAR